MKMPTRKSVYLLLCLIGIVLPMTQLIPFMQKYGFDIGLMVSQVMSNESSRFIAADLLIAGIASAFFWYYEGKRLKMMNWWLPIAAVFLVGFCLAVPLFLYLREGALEKK